MIAFKDTKSGAIIGLSQKVLFSFFALNDRFERLAMTQEASDFFLTRNPFDRAVSLFSDKCRHALRPDYPGFQDCQKVLLRAALLPEIREEILNLTFSRFSELLPTVRYLESHFWPQTLGLKRNVSLVPIESGLKCLGEKLGIDFSVKVNASPHSDWRQVVTVQNAAGILDAWGSDFDDLGYSRDLA